MYCTVPTYIHTYSLCRLIKWKLGPAHSPHAYIQQSIGVWGTLSNPSLAPTHTPGQFQHILKCAHDQKSIKLGYYPV